MIRVWGLILLALAVAPAGSVAAGAAGPQGPQESAVVAEIARIGQAARGTLGVAAVHLETGRRIAFRPDEFFPMASTVKVALAARILALADKGELDLAAHIPVRRSELAPEGPLGNRWRPGLALSATDLLSPMIVKSDNTATDVLFRIAGGPAAVHAHLRTLGIEGIYPARYIRELLREVLAIPVPASPELSLAEQFRKMPPRQTAARQARSYRANPAYDADPRDQATPAAMLGLLEKIWREEGVSSSARAKLLALMENRQAGMPGFRGRLPAGTPVADKTGTLAGSANDVGFITLPEERGHVALVVFIKGARASPGAREIVVADIARLVFDDYLLSAR